MMAAPARFILLVVAVVGVAAALVAPRGDEQLAMLRDEDKDAQIIALLEPRLALNENDPALLATLGRSYAAIGDHRRAIELLERYAALRPEDGAGYAQLADQYRSVGDVKKRIVMLQRSLAVTPSVSRAVELARLYRDQQQSAEALSVLSRFESRGRSEEWRPVAVGGAPSRERRSTSCDQCCSCARRSWRPPRSPPWSWTNVFCWPSFWSPWGAAPRRFSSVGYGSCSGIHHGWQIASCKRSFCWRQ